MILPDAGGQEIRLLLIRGPLFRRYTGRHCRSTSSWGPRSCPTKPNVARGREPGVTVDQIAKDVGVHARVGHRPRRRAIQPSNVEIL